MVLLCLGCSGNLCLVLYLEKENGERILHMFGGQRDKKIGEREMGKGRYMGNTCTRGTEQTVAQRNEERERAACPRTFAVLMISVKLSRTDLMSSFSLLL